MFKPHVFLFGATLCLHVSLGQSFEAPTWTFPTGEPIFGTPALEDKTTLYLPTEGIDSNLGSVIALDISGETPSQLWKFTTDDWIDSAPAQGSDGTLYVGSWNGVLYAINQETGAEVWNFDTESIIVASPAVAEDGTIIFPAYDGFLYALNPDGTEKWATFIGAEMDSSPSLDESGGIYVGTYDGTLIALDSNGNQVWEFTADTVDGTDERILASPAITLDGQIIFGSGNGYVYALDQATGTENWKTQFPEEVDSSPVLDDSDNIYFGTRSGFLVKLDSFGTEQWSVELGDIFFSSPVIDTKGNTYVVAFSGNNTSSLYAFDTKGQTLATATFDGLVDASPVITPDGRLIVCTLSGDVLSFYTGFGLSPTGWPKFGFNLANSANSAGSTTPSGLIAFFDAWEDLGSGWNEVEWFELFNSDNFPWIYHFDYEWLYLGGPGISEHWIYQSNLGWIWTRPDVFPYAFSAANSNWIYLFTDEVGQPWYFDYADSSWKIFQP